MRKIKFRVWCKEHSEWESNPTFIADNGALFCGLARSAIPLKDNTHVVMQYTGLKDKNGTEIYEGDIVVFKNWKPKSVVFQTNGVQTFVFDGTDLWLSSYDSEHYKVIGNIYQNPELLE